MKQTSQKITRFDCGEFYVDIIESKTWFESWLVHKKEAEAMYMWRSPKKQHTIDGEAYTITFDYFCEMVEANLPDYKRMYKELNGFYDGKVVEM